MKTSTMEWIEKAEGDWDVALRVYRARKKPNYDAACFHAQQCVEKYLKAELNETGLMFGKTHNLPDLLNQIATIEPSRMALQRQAAFLTDFAVQYRYPGWIATKAQAQQAIKDCRECGASSAQRLGCPFD